MKKALVSVINDLVTDQRVHRTCLTLAEEGYVVTLVGRELKNSPPLPQRAYAMHRFRMIFQKGPLFYLFFQVRLFFFLMNRKADLYYSNDLDTLLPNYFLAKWKGIRLIYDSHEIFPEVPELKPGSFKKKIWEGLERRLFPRLKTVITVNQSIAGYYSEKYGNKVHVIRNLPSKADLVPEAYPVPEAGENKVLILQGSGINVDRGGEELVSAMPFVSGANLWIVGGGDAIPVMKTMVENLKLNQKVFFFPRVSPQNLAFITARADIGVTLDKDTNLNYRLSLPNKIFDYFRAGIAVLGSRLPEIDLLFAKYKPGLQVEKHTPEEIASVINRMISDPAQLETWKKNASLASEVLNWEMEKPLLQKIIRNENS